MLGILISSGYLVSVECLEWHHLPKSSYHIRVHKEMIMITDLFNVLEDILALKMQIFSMGESDLIKNANLSRRRRQAVQPLPTLNPTAAYFVWYRTEYLPWYFSVLEAILPSELENLSTAGAFNQYSKQSYNQHLFGLAAKDSRIDEFETEYNPEILKRLECLQDGDVNNDGVADDGDACWSTDLDGIVPGFCSRYSNGVSECRRTYVDIHDGSSGPSYVYGNVYAVNSEGHYGPVCGLGDGWDDADAYVVCLQLGFSSGLSSGSGPPGEYSMSNVNCVGNENFLQDCQYSLDVASCSAGAGIYCYH